MARQKMLAGTKPHWPVSSPIMQMITLFAPATAHPCHMRRPTSTVEAMVSRQERKSRWSVEDKIGARSSVYKANRPVKESEKDSSREDDSADDVGRRWRRVRPEPESPASEFFVLQPARDGET